MNEKNYKKTVYKLIKNIAVMKKYKADNNLIPDLRIEVSAKVFYELAHEGTIIRTVDGTDLFHGIPVRVMKDWPDDYMAVC